MKETIRNLVKDKKVLILGYGREGQSSFRMVSSVGGYACLDIADANAVSSDLTSSHKVITGASYLDCLNDYDVVFKSPGIVLPMDISNYSCRITCQADLFLEVYGAQTIGITGTKGKSTTSSLLYHILKECGKDVLFGGNIGIPIFDITDQIHPRTIIVFELSCHQLEYAKFAPSKAILLNLYEDHLDHYGTVEKYWNAKKNIYRNQGYCDFLFCNPDFLPATGECKATVIKVKSQDLPFNSFEEIPGVTLRGTHNLFNTAFVYDVCRRYDISDEDFKAALATFKTLAHRLQYLGKLDEIDYYDDSISTTVESAISAVRAIPNAGTLLLGGMDRGIDYDPLVDFLPTTRLEHIILMYDSGKVILEKLKTAASPSFMEKVHYIQDLKDACAFAKANASKGTAVILSPASASYGVFKNFEQRGDFFKEYVGL
ncbi:UDP-N-acetylmuramoylalanine--D-glutamate ligase [Pseudobutyrivibrio sp. NOR37]|uniref:UDP-N-acetylmuramoylalanine--D-glutamate ligase n=1 Tax=Pseudobutyrivibrio xylanivorans TaxID=185007 RepID=A0A6M0LGP6_PSEXY|nr:MULTISPECIES: UDP-N-acetylmuramoyl-L-alanine--D-glutamate ligase [Pseudobutyrivibrio]NEX01712.1 UDP-N-acetylmuramoyl-L-alanine--D-glutamate ligase [Pseudobutyrivibrio xylanivorans]SFR71129.1 UDP-N-acetylmuramoylalanine--D-glutamate ligase [Pseudobutyrivibrio sp. NOR37]